MTVDRDQPRNSGNSPRIITVNPAGNPKIRVVKS